MNQSVLLSFELEGKNYVLANNRDVVKYAASKEPEAFDSLLETAKKSKSKKAESFSDRFDASENSLKILKALFASALVKGTPEVGYDEAVDIYELLIYNLEAEDVEQLTNKLMGLINNTDFIKGSNQRKATIKMKF